MYNFGEQQVISVGGDHAEPKLLRTAHSFRVVALGIKSFMRVSGVKPSPVCMSEMARNPYSIRDGSKKKSDSSLLLLIMLALIHWT